ncbi:MAG: hypothetical protein H0T47_02465 [Planctomycetaceae bacterium]|nr:hypothetical protein [Planctomycetaceae bacterium]
MVAGILHGLAKSVGLGDVMPTADCVRFVDNLQSESGGSTDPLVAVLLQQIGVSQVATGLLASKAATATNADDAVAYSTAAARLLGELRRCVSTVAEIRSGGTRATVVNQVVAQQNVAAGSQQIAFVGSGKKKLRKPN